MIPNAPRHRSRLVSLDQLRLVGRYASALPSFLRHTLTPDACRSLVAQTLAGREEAFRRTLRDGVFAHPDSPYLGLMRHAGVTRDDVDTLMRSEGIEGTLTRLHEAGVYVTLDEFKGRSSIRRGSYVHEVSADDFDNPLQAVHFTGVTGGSRGSRRRLLIDLGMLTHDAACYDAFTDAWDIGHRPMAIWRPVPPDNSGIKKVLVRLKVGSAVERWFSQNAVSWRGGQARFAAFTHFTAAAARALGRSFPTPEHVELDHADTVARWVADHVRAGAPPHVDTLVSSAVRVAVAAREQGLPIAGTTFRVGGEPLTPAKQRVASEVGARLIAHYSLSETGTIAMGCARGAAVDDVHVLESKVAVTIRPRTTPAFVDPVNAIYLTTLLPSTPKLLLNVETGDFGTLVGRECGCTLSRCGFHRHLHTIRSWEKLTSEGITFLGSTLVALMEDVLPGRFGGSPLDYQLVEEEDATRTRVSIIVSPRIGAVDESGVVGFVLDQLALQDAGHRLMADVWRQGGTLRVVRREPFRTGAGKVLPLHHMERR
ncbi:MAG: hypothetical protein ACRD2N_24025 [Vicinamibacterales bacterium]